MAHTHISSRARLWKPMTMGKSRIRKVRHYVHLVHEGGPNSSGRPGSTDTITTFEPQLDPASTCIMTIHWMANIRRCLLKLMFDYCFYVVREMRMLERSVGGVDEILLGLGWKLTCLYQYFLITLFFLIWSHFCDYVNTNIVKHKQDGWKMIIFQHWHHSM